MGPVTLPQFLIILAVVALILGIKRLSGSDDGSSRSRLRDELRGRMPVYSAETTDGKERSSFVNVCRSDSRRRFSSSWLCCSALLCGG